MVNPFTTLSLLLLLLLSLLCTTTIVEGARESYEGWKVVRALIEDEETRIAVSNLNLDVWSNEGVIKIGYNDIRVGDFEVVNLYILEVQFEWLISDLQNELDRELQELGLEPEFGISGDDVWFDLYHSYTDIVDKLDAIASDFSLIVTHSSIGSTYEGRAIPMVKVTGDAPAGSKQKVIVVGGLSGREWIAPATVIFIIQQLANLYGADESVTSLLDTVEIHFVPIANPDGYAYSWGTSRMWRNNRKLNLDGTYGVDLTKNWNAADWLTACTQPPSSDNYCGTAPLSELETLAISNYLFSHGPFIAAVEYSSYSQQVLRPFGSNVVLQTIGDTWASAMYDETQQVTYTSIAASSSSTNARDFFYHLAEIPLSFTIQLRDSGGYGFMLPVSQIQPTVKENYKGFTTFLRLLSSSSLSPSS